MGKNGDRLRAEKAKRTTYTFTKEELDRHDALVKEAYKKICIVNLREEFDKQMGTLRDQSLCMVLNCCLRVLVNDCGFTPYRNRRSRIRKFTLSVLEEIDKVVSGKISDYKYMLLTDKECGVKFQAEKYDEVNE